MRVMSGEEESRIEEERRRRHQARRERQRKRRKRQIIIRVVLAVSAVVLAVMGIFVFRKLSAAKEVEHVVTPEQKKYVTEAPDFQVELLEINEYSRPGIRLEKVSGIVVHYTANPVTTAAQNRGYFASLAETEETYASSHFVIGISGEIIQCVPCNEIAYASNDRNVDTISIECCIPDESGKFSDETYQSLVALVSWLVGRYELQVDDVIRHYDVTGKECPKYYVEHEDAWSLFKEDVLEYIDRNGVEKTEEIN